MSLLGIPTLIAGLILLLAGSSWFTGAHTVGVILTVVSGVWIVIGLIMTVVIGGIVMSRVRGSSLRSIR